MTHCPIYPCGSNKAEVFLRVFVPVFMCVCVGSSTVNASCKRPIVWFGIISVEHMRYIHTE